MLYDYEPMPIIDCGNFILRSIRKSDYKDLYEFGSDHDVTKFLSWGPYEDEAEAKWTIENYYLERPKKNLPIGYAIIYKDNNKMIGVIDFHTINHYDESGEIGFCLSKEYQGLGIMTIALKKMIYVGFEMLKLHRIEIKHAKENLASKRVIEKCDFRFEGILREAHYLIKLKKYTDVYTYSIIKDEYFKEELKWQ